MRHSSTLFRASLCALFCAAVALVAFPARASFEEVVLFDAALSLQKDSSLGVTETIIYDFGEEERHGIFRIIPTTHPQDASSWYKERYVDLVVSSTRMDGMDVPYEVTTPGDSVRIKIGDADTTITGQHTYVISYTARGALSVEEGKAELYWNVTGNDWEVPIAEVRASIIAPATMLAPKHSCYVGEVGAGKSCDSEVFDGGTVFKNGALSPSEGVSIAQAINPGTVQVETLERIDLQSFLFIVGILFLLGLPIFIYKVRTKHKVSQSVVAQYEPYEDVEPMYAGTLIDNRLDPKDITAAIVYLAEQGYLKITKIDKNFLFFDMSDYRVELLRRPGPNVGAFLPQALALLFGAEVGSGALVTLSEIRKSFSRRMRNHSILEALRSALREDMRVKGFLEETLKGFPSNTVARISWAVIIIGAIMVFVGIGYAAIFVIIAIAVVTLGVAHWMRRTRKGYEARNHLRGFKEFLSVTDRDRFDFHNAPEKNPEQFLKYLPYAIAFGVEKKWAEAFTDITIPNPGWYDGGAAGAFSAVAFTSDMSTFSSSIGSASGAAVSSGGGSVGGGAGGGGGGSW